MASSKIHQNANPADKPTDQEMRRQPMRKIAQITECVQIGYSEMITF